jgi:uroporphyrin-III C-methyltransferase
MTRGFVSLVGAGPGDPGLLTVTAVRRLREADIVFYDALVQPETLAIADHAARFYVGKRAGRPAIAQDTITRLLIRAARRGKRIVRLKGGDPFVFGRGGEEMLALRAAGIDYEVVPGISSAIAAPACAGIPVTHRGLTSAFVVVSGHDRAALAPVLGAIAPGTVTIVILMGLGTRAAAVELLLARGWSPDTPAAICRGAWTPDLAVWTGSLENLANAAAGDGDMPGTIVVGAVAALASATPWAEADAPCPASLKAAR